MKLIFSAIAGITFWILSVTGTSTRLFEAMGQNARLNHDVILMRPAGDAKITGTVSFPRSANATGRAVKGSYGKNTSRLKSGSATEKRAVVYIASAKGNFPAPQSRPAMRQKNIAITPRILPVLAGTTVDFPNEDDLFHNIFSLSPSVKFDLGRYAKGVSKSVKFTTPGVVKVFCDIHSTMGGVVLVLQNPYYTVTEADGSYALSGVPAGTYDLVAWHEGGTQTQKITISASGVITQNFAF